MPWRANPFRRRHFWTQASSCSAARFVPTYDEWSRTVKSVDIVIPVLNEGKHILQCLQSVLAFERPAGLLWRIFVVDGGSTDGTRAVVRQLTAEHPEIEPLDNPGRIQSCAMNIALHQGNGEYILRLDAHATYPSDYLMRCMHLALSSGADNVGGVFMTLPGADTYGARVVQALTTHRFGVGNAEFRLQPAPGPVDTVPYGFFKRTVIDRVGFFDERLVRCQDYELNRRIVASGGSVWLDPKIVVHYHNQPSVWGFLRKQLVLEAPYNPYLWYLAPYARAFRHGITGVFAAGIIGGVVSLCFSHVLGIAFLSVMALYVVLACASSIQQAVRYHCVWHVFTLPFTFFLFHFIHGLGILIGLSRLALGTAPVQRVREPWPGYGAYRIHPECVLQQPAATGASDRHTAP
jgi:glycosyltransferase involved in cell wall biosynthesis